MAHKKKIEVIPHKNKDGKFSHKVKDYQVVDRTRGKRVVVGVASTLRAADDMWDSYRNKVVAQHLRNHPNDVAFQLKHKITSGQEN